MPTPTYSMAPPAAYQQPTTYTMMPTVSSPVLRLARLSTAPVPLPQTSTTPIPTLRAPSITYQPKSGLVQGSIPGGAIPGGGLISLPVPGTDLAPSEPPAEEEKGLGDKIVAWWSHMPLSHKALTAGAVVAAGVGGWWLIWGRKKKVTPNSSTLKKVEHSRRIPWSKRPAKDRPAPQKVPGLGTFYVRGPRRKKGQRK